MRIFLVTAVIVLTALMMGSCKSGSGGPVLCDTTCMKDTLKFIKEEHSLQPHVYISAKDCVADTITWSYSGMGKERKLDMPRPDNNPPVHLDKDHIQCFFSDTSYAWILFNDCYSGRGYSIQMYFNKSESRIMKSALNKFDPKFSVADGLVAYTDGGNLFVENMATGSNTSMTFREQLDIDYNTIHTTIDSVNVTPSRIWAKVKIKGEWKEIESKIEFK